MLSAIRIFFGSEGSRPLLVLFSMMLASALEIIGIGVLLPLFSTTIGVEQPWLAQITLNGFSAFGIAPSTHKLIAILVVVFMGKYLLIYFAMNISSFAETEVSALLRTRLLRLYSAQIGAIWSVEKLGQLTNEIINNASRSANAYRQSGRLLTYSIQAFFLSGRSLPGIAWFDD